MFSQGSNFASWFHHLRIAHGDFWMRKVRRKPTLPREELHGIPATRFVGERIRALQRRTALSRVSQVNFTRQWGVRIFPVVKRLFR